MLRSRSVSTKLKQGERLPRKALLFLCPLYGHCSALLVSAGQTVKQGQVIAKVGSTGYSTGPHVHYEVIQNGVRVDAMWFYKK